MFCLLCKENSRTRYLIVNIYGIEFCIKTEKAQVSGNLNVQIHKNIDDNRIA